MPYLWKGIFVAILAGGICMSPGPAITGERVMEGAGATFPEPFYQTVFDAYYRQHGTRVNYRGVGSGAGMKELMAGRTDFAGTDIGVKAHGHKKSQNAAPLVRIPTCLGAIALVYNLPDNPKVRFTAGLLGEIFLGRITKWNDPRIVAINRNVRLPDLAINVVYRSDESGTSFIFSDFLGKNDPVWRKVMGPGGSSLSGLRPPVGLGAKSNPGVAGMVQQITGAIGYVELTYAVANGMTFGSVQNRAGHFVDPSPAAVAVAANGGFTVDNGISLTDTSRPGGYPISGFTWIVVFKEQNYGGRSREFAEELVRMLYWATHEGQKYASPLRYVSLPRGVVRKTEFILRSITYDGTPVLGKRGKGRRGR